MLEPSLTEKTWPLLLKEHSDLLQLIVPNISQYLSQQQT